MIKITEKIISSKNFLFDSPKCQSWSIRINRVFFLLWFSKFSSRKYFLLWFWSFLELERARTELARIARADWTRAKTRPRRKVFGSYSPFLARILWFLLNFSIFEFLTCFSKWPIIWRFSKNQRDILSVFLLRTCVTFVKWVKLRDRLVN